MADPRITLGGSEVVYPGEVSRDALCSLIGVTVDVATDAEAELEVRFVDRCVVTVPKVSAIASRRLACLPVAEALYVLMADASYRPSTNGRVAGPSR